MENRTEFNDFRQLLKSLENSETFIRLRNSGEAWIGFSKVILLSDSAMILQDNLEKKTILNIRDVVQFQVEKKILVFEAHTTYDLVY